MNEIVSVIVAIALGLGFLTVVGGGVAVIIARLTPGKPSPALEILRERYARGEITSDEYEQMRRRLAA